MADYNASLCVEKLGEIAEVWESQNVGDNAENILKECRGGATTLQEDLDKHTAEETGELLIQENNGESNNLREASDIVEVWENQNVGDNAENILKKCREGATTLKEDLDKHTAVGTGKQLIQENSGQSNSLREESDIVEVLENQNIGDNAENILKECREETKTLKEDLNTYTAVETGELLIQENSDESNSLREESDLGEPIEVENLCCNAEDILKETDELLTEENNGELNNLESVNAIKPSKEANVAETTTEPNDSLNQCLICLDLIITQTIGLPEGCEHQFCLSCLLEWSKRVNTCPVDRQRYTKVFYKSPTHGIVEGDIAIPDISPTIDIDEELVGFQYQHCYACGGDDMGDENVVTCMNCNQWIHITCLPESARMWLCPSCDDHSGFGDHSVEVDGRCFICGEGGHDEMMCCSRCSQSAHFVCALFSRGSFYDDGHWFCGECEEEPVLDFGNHPVELENVHCCACGGGGNNEQMMSCRRCNQWAHVNCSFISWPDSSDDNRRWLCPGCGEEDALPVGVVVARRPIEVVVTHCCACGGSGSNEQMMSCRSCNQWAHVNCSFISRSPDDNRRWLCPGCGEQDTLPAGVFVNSHPVEVEDIHCYTCGEGDSNDDMVFCGNCSHWAHFKCVSLSAENRRWMCPRCGEGHALPVGFVVDSPIEVEEIHCCVCGDDQGNEHMVLCSSCDKWVHVNCLTLSYLSRSNHGENGQWLCRTCEDAPSSVSPDDQTNALEAKCCSLCGEDENEGGLVLCRNCKLWTHIYCLTTGCLEMSDWGENGQWFCPNCHEIEALPFSDSDEHSNWAECKKCCVCGGDNSNAVMVPCNVCSEWLHLNCVTLSYFARSDCGQNGKWLCPNCEVEDCLPTPIVGNHSIDEDDTRCYVCESRNIKDMLPCSNCDKVIHFNCISLACLVKTDCGENGPLLCPNCEENSPPGSDFLEQSYKICCVCAIDENNEDLVPCRSCSKLVHVNCLTETYFLRSDCGENGQCLCPKCEEEDDEAYADFVEGLNYVQDKYCCVCGDDANNEYMILCSRCNQWVHVNCMTLTSCRSSDCSDNELSICPRCEEDDSPTADTKHSSDVDDDSPTDDASGLEDKRCCACGDSDDCEAVVPCISCDQWFHFNCLSLSWLANTDYDENRHLLCPNCEVVSEATNLEDLIDFEYLRCCVCGDGVGSNAAMVPCSSCDRWLHFNCLSLSWLESTEYDVNGQLLCPNCEDNANSQAAGFVENSSDAEFKQCCVCGDDGSNAAMVPCSSCNRWLHFNCLSLSWIARTNCGENGQLLCPSCEENTAPQAISFPGNSSDAKYKRCCACSENCSNAAMLLCKSCNLWFHLNCVTLSYLARPDCGLNGLWLCPSCEIINDSSDFGQDSNDAVDDLSSRTDHEDNLNNDVCSPDADLKDHSIKVDHSLDADHEDNLIEADEDLSSSTDHEDNLNNDVCSPDADHKDHSIKVDHLLDADHEDNLNDADEDLSSSTDHEGNLNNNVYSPDADLEDHSNKVNHSTDADHEDNLNDDDFLSNAEHLNDAQHCCVCGGDSSSEKLVQCYICNRCIHVPCLSLSYLLNPACSEKLWFCPRCEEEGLRFDPTF